MSNGNGHDPVAAAIAAVEAAPEPIPMRQFQVTMASTGRPAMLMLPLDATDGELAELAGWMLTAVLNTYRVDRAKQAGPQLVVASRMPGG